MGSLLFWGLTVTAALFCAGMIAALAKLFRRDLRLWRGEGVSVEGRVVDHVEDRSGDGTSKYPVYEFTTGNGRKYNVRGSVSGVRRAPLGSTRRLVYLPGAEHEAEPAGLGIRWFLYSTLIAATVGSGWFVVSLLTA